MPETPAQSGTAQGIDFGALRETTSGRVTHVISPALLQLQDGTLVYLSGLYYPDYAESQAGDYALLAMSILKDMLIGQDVTLYQTKNARAGRINRMGHALAHVVRKRDGVWVQGLMLGLGLAVVQTISTNPEMATEMLSIEERARAEQAGIWENLMAIRTPDSAAGFIGSFQIVEGRVESAALKNNRVYLNFGKNWRDDFTVTVAPEFKRSFAASGINLLDLNQGVVRVRGWLTEYNGPNMALDHPAALEVLETIPVPDTEGAEEAQPDGLKDSALPPALPLRQGQ